MVGANIPARLAGIMTIAMLASCILFMAGAKGNEDSSTHALLDHQAGSHSLALLASVTLTTVWEEWGI